MSKDYEKILASVWTMLPNPETMSIYNILLYLCHCHEGECFPTIDTISKYTKMGNRRVLKNIDLLENIGAICKKRRYNKSTIYTVKEPTELIKILKVSSVKLT